MSITYIYITVNADQPSVMRYKEEEKILEKCIYFQSLEKILKEAVCSCISIFVIPIENRFVKCIKVHSFILTLYRYKQQKICTDVHLSLHNANFGQLKAKQVLFMIIICVSFFYCIR